MSNMAYCRFENTYNDLSDCYNRLDEILDLSQSEKYYRMELIRLCRLINKEWGHEIE